MNKEQGQSLGKRSRDEVSDNHIRDDVFSDLSYELVTNDETDENSIKLIALKNIFSKQLPKMPKDYIVRLVFDKRHKSLAIKRNDRIIGGICYRQYEKQRFGEIAFCAINSHDQVRGYGTMLMTQLKSVAQRDGMEYFVTYADNFAIGYFQKQGFSKHISMPRDRWFGFIKDYDGGTLMECYIHPGYPYLSTKEVVQHQREFILDQLIKSSQNSVEYSAADLFEGIKRLQNALEVPGVVDNGWSSYHIYRGATDRDRNVTQIKLNALLKPLMDKLRGSKQCKSFLVHQSKIEQLKERFQDDYLDLYVIADLLKQGDYYRSKEAIGSDLLRMIDMVKSLISQYPQLQEPVQQMTQFINELFLQKEANEKEANKES